MTVIRGMHYTDEELEAHQHIAATRLALAASRLRDADDALVSLGRELQGTNADRGMPDPSQGERAEEACAGVRKAYAEMRDAEADYVQWHPGEGVPQ